MSVKKVLSLLLLVTTIIFSLPGCGSKSDPAASDFESEMVFVEFEWPDTDIAKLMPIPKSNVGSIGWSQDYGFVIYVANTTAADYAEYVKACEERGFTLDGRKGDDYFWADNEDGYKATVRFEENNVMFVRIDAPNEYDTPSEEPTVEPEESQRPLDISTTPPETEKPPEETPSITEPPAEETPSSGTNSLYYSTNTLERAKEGKSGMFSYKRSGQNYDQYWIIDFDEGCAYYFAFGNGNGICDRVQIDEGDLNSLITVTYHDGDLSWQYGLCFKRVRQPDRLIYSEADGTQYEFIATDLNEALKIRDEMEIMDY